MVISHKQIILMQRWKREIMIIDTIKRYQKRMISRIIIIRNIMGRKKDLISMIGMTTVKDTQKKKGMSIEIRTKVPQRSKTMTKKPDRLIIILIATQGHKFILNK